ncbi:MAG TPA: ParB/Srx family N-terminal domain-containing protein, partial [Desulfosalsimonadaceae bacterium]|nr:ParB/Srx family N-terminal domain-containing protein [Desulfosalsimonadaceae bacterium]
MNFSLAAVRLDRIDQTDETYKISTSPSDPQLAASIQAIGFINPPILSPAKASAYRIVSGFRRIAAGERLGWTEICSRVIS